MCTCDEACGAADEMLMNVWLAGVTGKLDVAPTRN